MPFLKKKSKIIFSRTKQIELGAQRNGMRHAIFNSLKDRYSGNWKNDQKCGYGTLTTRNKVIYEGHMKRNYRHGFGVLSQVLPNKKEILIYRGEWKNGYRCGWALTKYEDGSVFQGHLKDNKRDGYGQMWYPDKSFYDGNWDKNDRCGQGVWIRSDGNRYEGEWRHDKKNGKGRFFHLNCGQMQEGVWRDDNCVFNTLISLPFRQCAKYPNAFPIPISQIPDETMKEFETNAINGHVEPCFVSNTSSEAASSSILSI